MARVSCSRCFQVFDAEEGRPGAAPLCAACAARAPAAAPLPRRAVARTRPARRPAGRRALAAGVAVALLGAAALVLVRRERTPPAPPAPTVLETHLEAWREAGLLPARPVVDPAHARVRAAAGWAALAADLPARAAEALQAFRESIALSPETAAAAVAGYATALVEASGDLVEGAELRTAHELVREELSHGERPDLLAAYVRLLLSVPSAANEQEALAVAARAVAAAPADPSARLALGLAQLRSDPVAAARTLEAAIGDAPQDRRLVTAAARARWAAGDAAGALRHAGARLALDPGQPVALSLRAEVEAASDRIAAARATLTRWRAADPTSPLPPLLLARLAYQREDDLGGARRLLAEALARQPGDFTAARILAHRAAVERAAGNVAAAEAAVDEALRRVPASAPARYQAALLAFRRGNAAALREAAGVLGDRGGPVAARLLAARSAELSDTDDAAEEAYRALASLAARDPAVLLETAGALARLRAPGPALEIAQRALARDPLEARLRRAPTDFWEGPAPLAEAARRLEAIGRSEPRAAAVAFAAAATCELLLGRTVAAERLARGAAEASPQAIAPLLVLAQVALDRGQPRAAIPFVRSAVDLRPGDPVPLEVRGRVLEALGRNLDAEASHRAAAEAGPDLLTPRLALARLLVRRGERAEARPLLEALLVEDAGLSEARGTLLAIAPARGP